MSIDTALGNVASSLRASMLAIDAARMECVAASGLVAAAAEEHLPGYVSKNMPHPPFAYVY
jgi:hypothetical protein